MLGGRVSLLLIGWRILSAIPAKVWIVIAVLAALGAFYNHGWQSGYASADAKWQLVIAREKERIREENEAALNESRRRIAELNALLAKLEEDLRNAEEEARTDPNASRVCLGPNSVRRLNEIH